VASSLQLEAVVHAEAPERFRFLIDEFGYDGPEITSDGLAYFGRMRIHVRAHSGREPEVSTLLTLSDGSRWARLSNVYVHLGLGPAQDVPEGASSDRVGLLRLDAQAAALARLIREADPGAIEQAVVACHAR
jgi:hypothetical protein